MADVRVILRESDVRGAILPCSVITDNEIRDLRRWIACRGFTAGKSESKTSLVRRINDLINSVLSRYVIDPDGDFTSKFVPAAEVPLPPVHNWTEDLGCIPQAFNHTCLVNYLVHRKLRIVSTRDGSDSENEENHVPLPTAQKPLRKGYNFFASGHIDEVKTNCMDKTVHVRASVLSSYKENRYNSRVVIDTSTGEVIVASSTCVVGKGGKCNHITGLLFALVDFQMSLHCAPQSCTSKSQQWHKPARKAKRFTRPIEVGERKLQRHEYGRVVKRKRPLDDYRTYQVLKYSGPAVSDNQLFQLKRDLDDIKIRKHDSGLTQILNSSTDTASEREETDQETLQMTLTPEEKVLNSLQVTEHEQKDIEKLTRGQSSSVTCYRQKKGRITASNAKRCCGKQTAAIIKAIITVGKPRNSTVPALMYGVENEEKAAKMYHQQMADNGHKYVIKECGLFVHISHGQLAASPDRLVCDVTGQVIGLLEIKCLYSCKDMSPQDAVADKSNRTDFPVKLLDDTYKLKDKHQYYYQIQMQMAVCQLPWCDLVLFTSTDHPVLISRVVFDEEFWEATQNKTADFPREQYCSCPSGPRLWLVN